MDCKNKLVICNWKEYGDKVELMNYINQLSCRADLNKIRIVIAPPAPLLSVPIQIPLAAQHIDHSNGTARIRGNLLRSLGCKYTLCGHSEVGCIDKIAQIQECIKSDILPIVFVENEQDFRANYLPGCIWVYEPRTSIGTGILPEIEEINAMVAIIKEVSDHQALVLYGGSVTSENLPYLLKSQDLDGFCIGKASRDIEEMLKILTILDHS